MNRMGYDAATIGNHEFDFKDAAVAPILANAQFAVLAANFLINLRANILPLYSPIKFLM